MIACPTCGGDTTVTETRATRGGAKRRRKCRNPQCRGRCTTLEMVVAGQTGLEAQIAGRWVLMRVDKLEAALAAAQAAVAEAPHSVDLGRWDPGREISPVRVHENDASSASGNRLRATAEGWQNANEQSSPPRRERPGLSAEPVAVGADDVALGDLGADGLDWLGAPGGDSE